MLQPSKYRNGKVIPSHTLWWIKLLSMLELKLNHVSKRGSRLQWIFKNAEGLLLAIDRFSSRLSLHKRLSKRIIWATWQPICLILCEGCPLCQATHLFYPLWRIASVQTIENSKVKEKELVHCFQKIWYKKMGFKQHACVCWEKCVRQNF